MVDQIGSVGGFLPSPVVGTGNNTAKTGPFTILDSHAAAPNSGTAVVAARYISPVLIVDPTTKIVVYQQRDPQTGKVLNQYPSEAVVQQYKKADQQSAQPLTDATTNSPVKAQPPAQEPVAAAVPAHTTVTAPITLQADVATPPEKPA